MLRVINSDSKFTPTLDIYIGSITWPEEEITDPKLIQVKRYLSHFQSLTAAEEWLHALQHFKGRPLTKFADHEMDVAAWLIDHEVPLVDEFFTFGYPERRYILEDPEYKDRAKITSSVQDLGLPSG